MLLILVAVIVIVIGIIIEIIKWNKSHGEIKKIPAPNTLMFIGNALEINAAPVELFRKIRNYAKKYDGIYGLWTVGVNTVNIYNAKDVEAVISSTKHNSKSIVYRFLSPWLREGLLLSSGSKWQQRRKILTPTFHFTILRQFCGILEENSDRLVEALAKVEGKHVDIIPIISEYTLNSICETAMGTKLHESTTNVTKSYKTAIHQLGHIIAERSCNVLLFPDVMFYLSPLGRQIKKTLNTVHLFTKSVIKERRELVKDNGIVNSVEIDDEMYTSGKKRVAMLDLLLSAEKEGVIDSTGIQEEVDTFMFEGHDTTATGLTYCFMLLANHKQEQEKIIDELNDVFGDSNRVATMEDLSTLKYLECCIKESLRLYPPVPFIGRTLSEPTKLSNYTVPPGTHAQIHVYDLHRREDLFENAQVFNPDRFLPENSVGRHPYSYIPFSAGPRNCIGQRFAMMEMKSCVAGVLRRFRLEPVTRPQDLEFTVDMVLRSNNPVYVKFMKRNV